MPVVLLTTTGTSGAAEMFAAALVDNKRGTLVGEHTLGRAGLQKLVKLPDGSALWMTWARYVSPSGTVIHGTGLEPAVEVEQPDVEFGDLAADERSDPRQGARAVHRPPRRRRKHVARHVTRTARRDRICTRPRSPIPLDSPRSLAYNRSDLRADGIAARDRVRACGVAHQRARAFDIGLRRHSVNKQELIAKIVKDTGLTKVAAVGAVESLLDGITKSLKKGNPVTFVGFGSFQTSQRKARTRAQPADGRQHQGAEAPRRPLQGRQGPQGRDQLTPAASFR